MIRRKMGQIEWLEFEQLQEFPELAHGVFLRHGGCSQPPFDALNLGGNLDDPALIQENQQRVCSLLGIDAFVASDQIHGTQIESVSKAKPLKEIKCDGLSTSEKNLALLMNHADCQVAIFFDPVQKVVANIHCGWRGSAQNIYAQVIQHLEAEYGSAVEDLLVCISPSLGPENAEFINYRSELPTSFYSFQVRPNYFDFWEISKMQLKKAGVLGHHIEIAQICTFLGEKDFFSHRRDKKTGRNGTIVALKR